MDMNQQPYESPFADWKPPEKKKANYFRRRARALLKGKWVITSVASFIYMLINSLVMLASILPCYVIMLVTLILSAHQNPSGIEFIILPLILFLYLLVFLGTFLVGAPLTVGYCKIHLDVADGKAVNVGSLFSAFKTCYRHSVGACFRYYMRTIGAALNPLAGFFVYNLLLIILTTPEMKNSLLYGILMLVGFFITYISTIALTLRTSYRYILSFFLLAEHPELRSREALRQSAKLMEGNKMRMFRLHLSFIGWMLLLIPAAILTCGIGAYVGMYALYAYILTATAAFYDEISGRTAAKEAEEQTVGPDDYQPDFTVS